MPTQFTIYQSTDASAPVISGTAGALTALLDAVLVNGYGAKSPAGWSIAYTAANRRVYRQGAGSADCYYRVRDDGGGTGGAREALIYGAEAMSDVNTVVSGKFPSNAQSALTDNSLVIRKSAALDATARVWIAFADSRTCYLFIQDGDVAATYKAWMFGDVYPLDSNNIYRAAIICRSTENATTADSLLQGDGTVYTAITNAPLIGHFIQRNYTGIGSSFGFTKMPAVCWSSSNPPARPTPALNVLDYPNGPDGGLWLSRCPCLDAITGGGSSAHVFGWLRGVWFSAHRWFNFSDRDTLNGTGPLAGKSFMAVKGLNGSATNYGLFMETSNTVE